MSEEYKGIANKALNVVANVEWAKERTEMLASIERLEKMSGIMTKLVVDLAKKIALSDAKLELAVDVAAMGPLGVVMSREIQAECEMLEQNTAANVSIDLIKDDNGDLSRIEVGTELVPRENN